jgi:hypothetical protein
MTTIDLTRNVSPVCLRIYSFAKELRGLDIHVVSALAPRLVNVNEPFRSPNTHLPKVLQRAYRTGALISPRTHLRCHPPKLEIPNSRPHPNCDRHPIPASEVSQSVRSASTFVDRQAGGEQFRGRVWVWVYAEMEEMERWVGVGGRRVRNRAGLGRVMDPP